ncbi:unnamed protein product [Orchesella dallaii]|uniref:Uncharacterized protein n=1 Tax=Orchesella dallaii TaxID=48710 RepID=A0ABP1QFV5_9HEXA
MTMLKKNYRSSKYGSRVEKVSKCKVHFHGPPGFSWDSFIKSSPESRIAPDSNFPNLSSLLICNDSGVRLAALWGVDSSYILILGSLYDYWTDCTSPFIHPVGWCSKNGVDITPPHCYESPAEFDWDEYLEKTNSVAMPNQLFKPSNPIPFNIGHQIEVVDKRSPRLLRRATIAGVESHMLTLHFDALDSEIYDYTVDEDCEDIHVVGWGLATGHPIADEYEVDDLENENSFPVCPNHKVCRSVCSVKGPSVAFHSKVKDCRFAKQHIGETGNFTGRVVVFEDKFYDIGGVESNHGEVESSPTIVVPKPKLSNSSGIILLMGRAFSCLLTRELPR